MEKTESVHQMYLDRIRVLEDELVESVRESNKYSDYIKVLEDVIKERNDRIERYKKILGYNPEMQFIADRIEENKNDRSNTAEKTDL
jgi:GTP-sensing pleiotropic transcriptional regulator CodY